MDCPACGATQPEPVGTECARCGIVFAKVRVDQGQPSPGRVSSTDETQPATSPDRPLAARAALIGRGILYVCVLIWTWRFVSQPMGTAAMSSFLHGVNLVFHEAGHILFLPVGAFLTALGGSLMQLLVPMMCLVALVRQNKDREDANLIFNQSLGLAALSAGATLVLGYGLAGRYMDTRGADAVTVDAGMTYLYWFLPGLGLQFALISMGSALRGTGIVTPTIVVQVSTVLLNAILSPIMIAGWLLIAGFTEDPAVIAVGAEYLRIISWNFLATGIIFTNSSMFQAMGNTVPALLARATRLATFVVPAVWLTTYPAFELWHLWYLSVVTVALQAGASWWMLMGEFRKRLGDVPAVEPAPHRGLDIS